MLALYEPSRSLAHLPTACRALTHGRSLRRLVPRNGLGVRWCSSEKREQETPDPPEPWLGWWFFQLKHLWRDLDELMSFYSFLFYLLLPTWIELWNQKEAPEFPESSLLLTSPVFSLGSAEGVAAERVTLSLQKKRELIVSFLFSLFSPFKLFYVFSFISVVFPVFLWFPIRQTFGEKLVVFGLALRGAALLPRFAGSAQLLRFAGVGPMAVGAAVSLYELGGWRLVLAVPTSVGVAVSASMLTEQKLEEGTKGGPQEKGLGTFGISLDFLRFFVVFLFLVNFSGWLVDSCFFWMSGMVNHVYRFL